MKILGIETSCDETSVSVVEEGRKVLSLVVASSIEIHKKYGGIVPEEAAREQLRVIIPVLEEAVMQSNLQMVDIDALAVTAGPGLLGSLLVGVESAKTLSYVLNKPLVPVNHMRGHIYACWLTDEYLVSSIKSLATTPDFPALVLIVSGGHTELVLMSGHGKYKLLGSTRDDAAGEAFDKTARLLGLPYPGGPEISRLASLGNSGFVNFPRPMVASDNFDFSFSGLKTAVLYELKKYDEKDKKRLLNDLCASVQEAIVDSLVAKTVKALESFRVKSLLIVGGVAANQRLREKMRLLIANKGIEVPIFIPPVKYCTDNAAYIASCAFFNYNPLSWEKIEANPSIDISD